MWTSAIARPRSHERRHRRSPALHELGITLAAHVRGEERELFVLIERVMPAEDLAALAAELARAEGDASTA